MMALGGGGSLRFGNRLDLAMVSLLVTQVLRSLGVSCALSLFALLALLTSSRVVLLGSHLDQDDPFWLRESGSGREYGRESVARYCARAMRRSPVPP